MASSKGEKSSGRPKAWTPISYSEISCPWPVISMLATCCRKWRNWSDRANVLL